MSLQKRPRVRQTKAVRGRRWWSSREADVRDGGRRGLGKVIWDSQKGEVRKKR